MTEGRRVWTGFAALCLLSGSSWILGQFWTNPLAPIQQIALGSAAMAVFAGSAMLSRRLLTRVPVAVNLQASVWATVLFALPALISLGAAGHVEPFTSALVYTLVPAFVVFGAMQMRRGFGPAGDRFSLMLPSLAGFGGAALLFPFRTPESAAAWGWFLAVLAAAGLSGLAAIRLYTCLRRADVLSTLAVSSAASSAAGLGLWILVGAPLPPLTGTDLLLEAISWSALNVAELLLILWLVGRVPPVEFASRYLLIPAVTILEGWVVLRPDVSWTTPSGLLLMAGAGVALLRSRSDAT